MRKKTLVIQIAVVALVATLVAVPLVSADNGTDSTALRDAVTFAGVRAHQQAFQGFADANGGTRVAGTAGYDASAAYVHDSLEQAGYNVSYQQFDFDFFQELTPAELEQTAPGAVTYT